CLMAPTTDVPADVRHAPASAGRVLLAAALLSALAACSASMAGTARLHHRDPGDTSVALPDAILRALQTDELVLGCADGVTDGRSRFARDWVGAHRIDLDADGGDDWILNGL